MAKQTGPDRVAKDVQVAAHLCPVVFYAEGFGPVVSDFSLAVMTFVVGHAKAGIHATHVFGKGMRIELEVMAKMDMVRHQGIAGNAEGILATFFVVVMNKGEVFSFFEMVEQVFFVVAAPEGMEGGTCGQDFGSWGSHVKS
jgi:hypothetical protein